MEGLRIYYLENLKDDFLIFKDELNEKGYIVYPKNLKIWTYELSLIFNYLKSNEEEKTKLLPEISTIFKNYNVDLFIFDYYLIETECRSITIFNDILKTDTKLVNIPVIFLTIEDNDALLPIDRNTGFVLKNSYLSDENVNDTFVKLNQEMEKFPSLLNKRISDKKNSKVIWLRKNF